MTNRVEIFSPGNKMMNERDEQLSALMDDYRHTEQNQSVLNDVLNDVNRQYTLQRYQLMREVMRNETPEYIKLDFTSCVKAKISMEPELKVNHIPAVNSDKTEKLSPWVWSVLFKPVAGLAVAALVAIVAISVLQIQPDNPRQRNQSDQLATYSSTDARVEHLASIPAVVSNAVKVSGNSQSQITQRGMSWKIKRNEPAMQNKLNAYLVSHNENSKSIKGIIPQARVVGFDGQR